MDGERPASGRFLEGRGGELFGFEALGERVSDFLRGRGVAREPRDRGGDGRRIGHCSALLRPIPGIHRRISQARVRRSTNGQQPYSVIVHGIARGAQARFRTFVACFCKRSSAFCTGLSPPPRSPRSDWKAIDSTPNRETQGPTPMITARLAVASDGSGRLL